MGDHHPRRLSIAPTFAGSSIAPVLPLHESQSQENATRRERRRSSASYELQPYRRTEPQITEIDTSFDWEQELEGRDAEREREDPGDSEDSQMTIRKTKSRSPASRARGHQANGSASSAVSPASMNGSFRERSKHGTSLDIPEDSAQQTARLMGHSSFTLDEAPPLTPGREDSGKSFFELPEQDRRNFMLLCLLYFLQGIPMGLATGSVPFLLKSYLSYGQIGVYSLASYPYSLKLLWSPIVDAVWSAKVGRRKSWILPIQTLSGFGMIWLGSRAQYMMEKAGEDGGAGVWGFTGWWFSLVFMCATQDIAVDGKLNTPIARDGLRRAEVLTEIQVGHSLSSLRRTSPTPLQPRRSVLQPVTSSPTQFSSLSAAPTSPTNISAPLPKRLG